MTMQQRGTNIWVEVCPIFTWTEWSWTYCHILSVSSYPNLLQSYVLSNKNNCSTMTVQQRYQHLRGNMSRLYLVCVVIDILSHIVRNQRSKNLIVRRWPCNKEVPTFEGKYVLFLPGPCGHRKCGHIVATQRSRSLRSCPKSCERKNNSTIHWDKTINLYARCSLC